MKLLAHSEDLKGYKKISKTRNLISQLKLTRSNIDRAFAAYHNLKYDAKMSEEYQGQIG